MEREYSEDRLYWASVKRFTMILESDEAIDPKLVSEIVKFLDNAEIGPAVIPTDEKDPAHKMAKELKKQKQKQNSPK